MISRKADRSGVHAAEHLRALASDLRHLRERSSIEAADLDGWHREVRIVVERWRRDLPGVPIAPEIWRYLHDADIRLRDPDYRGTQEALLDVIIADLERGVLPSSDSISIPLRWPLVALLFLVPAVALYLYKGFSFFSVLFLAAALVFALSVLLFLRRSPH